jgi:hypothetical protein
MNKLTPEMDVIFRFARGDLSAKEFEAWVYAHGELGSLLGQDLYLGLASTNYSEASDVDQMTNTLVAWAEGQIKNRCLCRAMRDNDRKIIGQQEWLFTATFLTIRRRTPWIRLDKCEDCGDYWFIATDSTYDDESFFHRIDEQTALNIINNGTWAAHPFDRDVFWPTQEWLCLNGYSSLEEWQSINEYPAEVVIGGSLKYYCYNNRKEIEASAICGCFGCMNIFEASKIKSWTDRVLGIERTALCPLCAEARVIGNTSGVTLDRQYLTDLKHKFV